MLEAQIQIDKELAVKGYRRALKYKALREISYFYASRLTIAWLVIAFANALMGAGDLTNFHLLCFVGLWIAATIHGYIKWRKKIEDSTNGWTFYAVLSDAGVKTQIGQEDIYNWEFYESYVEYDDYLQINDSQGGVIFLPKTSELNEIVAFTKNKISQKQNSTSIPRL